MKNNDYIEKGKRNALLGLKIFVIVILFFTFFSKSIMGWFLPRVDIKKVDAGILLKVIRTEGVVSPKKKISVYTDISTRVLELHFRIEDKVKEGELILTLDSQPVKVKLANLEMDLKKQEISMNSLVITKENAILRSASSSLELYSRQFEKAREGYNKSKTLFSSGAISEEVLKNAKDALATAEENYTKELNSNEKNKKIAINDIKNYDNQIAERQLALEILNKQIEETLLDLENCSVVAVADGVIKELSYEEGMLVNGQTPLYTLNNSSEGYVVEADLPLEQGKFVAVDDKFSITIESLGKVIEGKVVEKRVSKKTEHETIIIAIKNSKIHGGERAEVFLRKQYAKYDARVPRSAIYASSLNDSVYVLIEEDSPFGKSYSVKKREVLLGETDERNVGVQDGVFPGEKVIIKSSRRLNDGDKVIVNE